MLTSAVVLQRSDARNALAFLTVDECGTDRSNVTLEPAQLPEAVGYNPQAGMTDLVDAIQRQQDGVLALDRGKGRGYRVTLQSKP